MSEEMNGTLVLISDVECYISLLVQLHWTLSVVSQPHACMLSEGEVSPRSFFTDISTQLAGVHITYMIEGPYLYHITSISKYFIRWTAEYIMAPVMYKLYNKLVRIWHHQKWHQVLIVRWSESAKSVHAATKSNYSRQINHSSTVRVSLFSLVPWSIQSKCWQVIFRTEVGS